ncbi:hypothetical protein Q1695_002166 [Nippostrongylus brasiliensis]|nr:hypothetical protein Q1695_002166 [Nippostrongylus brasiliensis]
MYFYTNYNLFIANKGMIRIGGPVREHLSEMSLMFYVNYISTVVEVLSAMLLAFEVIAVPLFCRKAWKCSFTKCFIFYGWFGLFSWAVSFQLLRFIGNSSVAYLSLNCLLSGFTFHGYLLSSTLLTLNRFSCIVFPFTFEKIWSDRRCYLYMLIVMIITFASVAHRIGAPIRVEWEPELNAYRWLGYYPTIHWISLAFTLIICFCVSFGSIALNTCTFYCWRKQTISRSIYVTQRNLFLFSILSFIFSSSMCVQQLVANIFSFSGNQSVANVIVELFYPLNSVSVCVEPYFLLFFNRGVRKELISLLMRRKPKDVDATRSRSAFY